MRVAPPMVMLPTPVKFGRMPNDERFAWVDRIERIETINPHDSMFYELLVGLTIPQASGQIRSSTVPRLLLNSFMTTLENYDLDGRALPKLHVLLTLAEQGKKMGLAKIRSLADELGVPLEDREALTALISKNNQDQWVVLPQTVRANPSPAAAILAVFAAAVKTGKVSEFTNAFLEQAGASEADRRAWGLGPNNLAIE